MTIVLKDEPLKSLDPKKLSNPERDEIPPQLSKDEDERETQRYKRISFMWFLYLTELTGGGDGSEDHGGGSDESEQFGKHG